MQQLAIRFSSAARLMIAGSVSSGHLAGLHTGLIRYELRCDDPYRHQVARFLC